MKKNLLLILLVVLLAGCSYLTQQKNQPATDDFQTNQSQVNESQTNQGFYGALSDDMTLKNYQELFKTLPNQGEGLMDVCYWPKQKELKDIFPDYDFSQVPQEYKELIAQGGLQQVCEYEYSGTAFVLYAELPDYNNLIGFFTEDLATGEEKLLLAKQKNPPMGDIGVCRLTGLIEGNLIYNCGGGDGPGGFNTVYLLDRVTGKSKIIKKCEFFEDKTTCEINLLNSPAYPF
jgi:hypothetical protein